MSIFHSSFFYLSFFILSFFISNISFLHQGNVHERSSEYQWPTDSAVMNKLRLWQDQKFGVLIHWGLYSVPGIVESWSICDEDWITRDTTMTYQQYKDWYWGLADAFRPVDFDPGQWAKVAQEAGMKYMIFTTKHHDGFCLWDSRQTDFTIARHAYASDARRDVLRHVLEAFRTRDFMIGTYFSKPDWHSQYYWWDVYSTKASARTPHRRSHHPRPLRELPDARAYGARSPVALSLGELHPAQR